MSSRGRRMEAGLYDEPEPPSRCSKFLYYTWKFCTCVFSHTMLISMVVSYCIFGAFTFESLEAENERMVKKSIGEVRNNVTEDIWQLTRNTWVLHQENWTSHVIRRLRKFETDLLKAMKKDGWDGNEDLEAIQWTFSGALFYSIIVITTIGYGHIAPKTHWGKVVTIFYAILGIPLMLLCLSNIGDIMATSFRFLYWRVCCYVCTKKPKRHRRSARSSRGGTIRQQGGRYSAKRSASFRRSVRTSQRSADSGFGLSDVNAPSSYSDTECRYNGTDPGLQRTLRPSQISHFSDTGVSSLPSGRPQEYLNARGGSLDRSRGRDNQMIDQETAERTPVLCNKYAVDKDGGAKSTSERSRSVPHQYLEPPVELTPPSPVETSRKRERRRTGSAHHNPSPRIMSPMGFAVHRQRYDDFYDDDDYFDDMYGGSNGERRIKPVPIWLCVFLVVSYILGGAFLFTRWENWVFLDSAYFCFITLTTIGFGDFVPAKRVKQNAEVSIALCSLYLLFGIALLAMSFNLVQEEVIANVKSVAKRLGIIKDDEEEDVDD